MPKLSNQARAERLDRIRKENVVGTVDAAIYLDVSKRTLERWRLEQGVGPKFIPPEVAPGKDPKTRPFKYRVAELDGWLIGRESQGGFSGMSFATNTAWALNDQGQMLGNAFDLFSPAELDQAIDEDLIDVMTLHEALDERWATASAMQPYYDELVARLDAIKNAASAALNSQRMLDDTPEPSAPPRIIRP